jgi:hypothetical protein
MMPETTQTQSISSELMQFLGKIDTRLSLIESAVNRLDKAVNGTGRPGLIEDHRALQLLVSDHLKRTQEDHDARGLMALETKEAKELLATEARESKEMLAKEIKDTLDINLAKHEKISVRVWAIIIIVIGAFVTNAAGLAVLFIRTGGIH